MKKTLLKSLALVAVGSIMLVGSAMALPLSGGLSMTGTWQPVDEEWADTTLADATGINFQGWYAYANDNTFFVTTGTFDFSSLVGKVGDIYNFQFYPPSTPVTPLWSVEGYSFVMTSLTVTGHDTDSISIFGNGVLSAPGFDGTPGIWNFTAQEARMNFSWSASSAAVPEPATMILFGTGLIGLAGVARRKKN